VLTAHLHLPFKEPEPALAAPSPASAWKFNPELMQDVYQGCAVIHPDFFPQRMQPDQMFSHGNGLPGTAKNTLRADNRNLSFLISITEFFSFPS
jgi:hypothetical protein